MFKKLCILLIFSKLKVTKLLIDKYRMHNLYAIFAKLLNICKQIAGNLVNESGNVPRRGVVPKFSDLEVVALNMASEAVGIDSESLLLSEISDNRSDSLSIPTASDAMFKATTSRSENLGTTPRLGTFPDSLTKLPAICLHMFSNFANIAYKLCIRYLSIKSLVTFNLLNINNMHNFLNINLL